MQTGLDTGYVDDRRGLTPCFTSPVSRSDRQGAGVTLSKPISGRPNNTRSILAPLISVSIHAAASSSGSLI